MIQGFDISPLFSSSQKVVLNTEDYDSWRDYFYGTLDPKQFLMRGGSLPVGENDLETTPARGIGGAESRESLGGSREKRGPNGPRGGKRSKRSNRAKSHPPSVVQTVLSKPDHLSGDAIDGSESAGYYLSRARAALLSSGGWESSLDAVGTSVHIVEICDCLNRALSCRVSPRERSQICHCLRYFSGLLGASHSGGVGSSGGVTSGSSEGSNLLGVVFEFDYGEGPTLMYASQEGFSSMYWVGGGVKAPHYDGGTPVDLANKILNISREYLLSVYDELDGGLGTPSRPRRDFARLSLVTTKGLWTVLLSRDKLKGAPSGVGGLYKSFVNLFNALLGPSAAFSESPLTRGQGQGSASFVPLPLDLFVDRVSHLDHRIYAFGADLFIYVIGFSLFTFLLSFFISTFGIMSLIFYLVFVFSLFPVLSAWMESSPNWGYSTLGKKIFGIRVFSIDTAEETSGPSFFQALARNMVKYTVSPLFCFTGFMWALYSPHGRAWHDLLGDTVVLTNK